jgi:hypothetical protein
MRDSWKLSIQQVSRTSHFLLKAVLTCKVPHYTELKMFCLVDPLSVSRLAALYIHITTQSDSIIRRILAGC